MQESADLVLRNKILDWHRRIRSLCPKQPRQRIQIFDAHGVPLLPKDELARIKSYFDDLYHDPSFHHAAPPGLTHISFIEADIYDQIRRLPMTKALDPDGVPALIWKYFASELTPIVNHDVNYFLG